MWRRAPGPDPATAAVVRARLEALLAEQSRPTAPRRAQAASSPADPDALAEPAAPAEVAPRADEPAPVPGDDRAAGIVGSVLGRWSFTRAHAMVLATVVLVGLLASGWAVLRARPVAIASPVNVPTVAARTGPAGPAAGSPSVTAGGTPPASPAAASPAAGSGSTGASGSTSPAPAGAGRVTVHVLGAVHHPGLYTLPAGARVADALARAGGLTAHADPADLNLAQRLNDADQVVVGTSRQPLGQVRSGSGSGSDGGSGAAAGTGTGTGSSAGGAGGSPPAVVDLNRATETDLDGLPGVGPVTAQRILAWRTDHGRFTRVEELQEVAGIGPKTFADIAPHVRV